MSAEFTKLCKRLMIASAVAVLTPLAAAAVLGGASVAADATPATEQAAPAPHTTTASLDRLGRARAVSWISSGHISH